jgi:LysR family transcriptional regulator, regulator for metE and metH
LPPNEDMNVKLEIRHLRLLDAVAEEGSVTGAAKRLHTTQSALSHQLRDAEERLDARLFLRLGKKMVLTPAGGHLLGAARRVLEELRRAEEQVSSLNNGTGGLIRLTTECYTCYHWLPPLLKRFHRKFPKVEVTIDAQSTTRAIDALLEGKLDVAILSSPPKNKTLELTPIVADEMVVMMAPEHPLARQKFIRPRDFAGETVIIYPPREESTLLQKYLIPANIEPKDVLEIPLTEAVIEMTAAGMGIALVAQWSVAPQAKSGRVITRPFTRHGLRRTWYAATLRDQACSPSLAEFVELLAQPRPSEFWPGTLGLENVRKKPLPASA